MQKILLAGATGYLGSRIATALRGQPFYCKAVVRNPARLEELGLRPDEVLAAELTDPQSLRGCCEGMDVVISTVGITRQKDGLTYLDVDYQANLNLLEEAVQSGVRKFIFVSVLNGERLRHLKICDAKEKFVDKLKEAGIDYCVIRPNGFFSDMSEFFQMAKSGRVYLFGSGTWRMNPIDGDDLAEFCLKAIDSPEREMKIGGPETLTQDKIAALAFDVLGTKPRIVHLPDWTRRLLVSVLRIFTSSKTYGPIEFFLTVMAMDMVAPEYGKNTLRQHFTSLHHDSS